MENITLTKFNFKELSKYIKIFDNLDSSSELKNFNSSFIFFPDKEIAKLIIQDAVSSFINYSFPCNLESKGDENVPFGVKINSHQLMYVLTEIEEKNQTSSRIEVLVEEDVSFFTIISGLDTVKLNNALIPSFQLKSLISLCDSESYNEGSTQFHLQSLSSDVQKDFIQGIVTSYGFVSDDESTNNSVSIGKTKIVSNGVYFLSSYLLQEPIHSLSDKNPLLLYKKNIAIVDIMVRRGVVFDLKLGENGKKIKISSDNLIIVLNNSMSNSSFVSEEDFNNFIPSIQPTVSFTSERLSANCLFLESFFSSATDRKISISFDSPTSMKFFIQNESFGLSGSYVERKEQVELPKDKEYPYEVKILYKSFKNFCHLMRADAIINIHVKFDKNHPVIMLQSGNKSFYTAKLIK